MTDEIAARVEAFIADFHQRWERHGKPQTGFSFDRAVYDRWVRELSALIDVHGMPGGGIGVDGAMSSPAVHDPACERITAVEVDGDEAAVRSIMDVGTVPTYYEYRLVRRGGEWRIGQILSFLDPPGAPLVDEAEAARLLAGATEDAPLSDIDPDLELDLRALFSAGRQVVFSDEPATIEVTKLGEITCHLGVLTVRDFGYGDFDLDPLDRRVPAGSYPVEVATVERTNVALRVRLSELTPVSWHPATRTNGSHVAGGLRSGLHPELHPADLRDPWQRRTSEDRRGQRRLHPDERDRVQPLRMRATRGDNRVCLAFGQKFDQEAVVKMDALEDRLAHPDQLLVGVLADWHFYIGTYQLMVGILPGLTTPNDQSAGPRIVA